MRVDDLARAAGVATTTIRLYQSKGLLPPPRLVGRTGYYGDAHLTRLEVIARLQDEGFSLAGIASLLERWERGEELADVVGAEEQLGGVFGHRQAITLTAEELLERFPPGAMQPEFIQRAAAPRPGRGDRRRPVPRSRRQIHRDRIGSRFSSASRSASSSTNGST